MSKYIEAEKLKLKVSHEMDMQDTYLPVHFFDIVDDMPAADVVEVRHGMWEHYEHREPRYDIMGNKTWAEAYKCSNCGFIHSVIEDFGHYAFCPMCGATMDEVEE